VSSAQYPRRIDYTIAVTGVDGTVARSNHYRASYRPEEDAVSVAPISQEEASKPPPVPHGFNFAFTASVCGGRCDTGSATLAFPAGHPDPSPDLIGVPLLAPTYMFGMSYQREGDRTAQIVPPSNIPVIAVVSSQSRDYAVTLVDSPVVEGAPCYHLRLTPLRKPKTNRLRELWIGANDYLPRRDRRRKFHARAVRRRPVDDRLFRDSRSSVHTARKRRRYALSGAPPSRPGRTDFI